MNKLFKTLSLLAAMAFLVAACAPAAVDAAEAAPEEASYQAMLGRPLSDQTVTDFIASNNCAQAGSFHLCQPAGLALWTDADQTVKTVYLYVSNAEGFAPYKGELPLGLAAADTMADVEEKLGQPKEVHAPQAGWAPGLPDEGGSPDRIHYWAVYERFGVTIVYNSPAPNDKNASIHAILVEE
jgi:hypothetical protein